MPLLRTFVLGSVCTIGGSISRPRDGIYREAADLAYYFHWGKSDIMEMAGKERKTWLGEIKRIHMEQKMTRDREFAEQMEQMINIRADGQEQ